jgi:hypothetical protein
MLYHFSEDDSIEIFIPQEKQNRPDFPAVVWAIDEEHAFTYFFPRDCPRIVLRKSDDTSEKNLELFFGNTTADTIVVVENEWFTKISDQKLYRYSFNDENFQLFDKTAGYYISHHIVEPIKVDVVTDLIQRLINKGVELRFTPNLNPLREMILASDFKGFGIHKFNNAKKL